MKKEKFFICEVCGNLVEKISDSGVPIICCGQPMTEIVANTQEASVEKHLPVIKLNGDRIEVEVGADAHPMIKEHYIEWIYIQTSSGVQRKDLNPEEAPAACFTLCDDELIAAYAYCNLHGLWKTEA